MASWSNRESLVADTLFGEFWAGAATRQIDAKRMIAYADELTAPDGEWAGLIDTEHIATAGHSSGGWAALAGGGAQLDFGWCAANPDLVNEGTDCTQFPAHQDEIAALLGLQSTPETLWPPTNDPRVDAVIALAPDGDIWGATMRRRHHDRSHDGHGWFRGYRKHS